MSPAFEDDSRLAAAAPSVDPAVTEVLDAWKAGDDQALQRLLPLVYRDLRAIAGKQLRGEREGHTLQPTALVNEAFLRLRNLRGVQWKDRAHFFAFASRMMRRILVDHARRRHAGKRGSGAERVEWADAMAGGVAPVFDAPQLIDLDRALDRLAAGEPGLARLVEMRYFGGLTVEESAQVLGCSESTVKRDWAFARAWLLRELSLRS